MASFEDLATEYVLAVEAERMQRLLVNSASALQSAPNKTAAVSSWAQSIGQWVPRGPRNGEALAQDPDEAGDGGDAVARAKALAFLAGTLGELDEDFLGHNQVDQLVTFFGKIFVLDHKSGVLAAAQALKHLINMRNFGPGNGSSVLRDLVRLGDDFCLQPSSTRQEIYFLIGQLVCDKRVRTRLEEEYGTSCEFIVDLIHLCRHERDPGNLLAWFKTLAFFFGEYTMSTDVAGQLFKSFSTYFPISMRSSTGPSGITVADLKSALRLCFSTNHLAANLAFDFLLDRLDQGDAVTVSVKVDVLKTIQACIEGYDAPSRSLAPHVARIWNSLKQEVRDGEVRDSVEGTLDVIRALSKRLSQPPVESTDRVFLEEYVRMALADCLGDLANPTYVKQSGMLLASIAGGSLRAYNLTAPQVIQAVRGDLARARPSLYARDLVAILNAILEARYELVRDVPGERQGPDTEELHSHDSVLRHLLEAVYLRNLGENMERPADAEQEATLQELIMGLGKLLRQQGRGPEGTILCTAEQCAKVFTLLCPLVVPELGLTRDMSPPMSYSTISVATATLRDATASYPAGFDLLARAAFDSTLGADSTSSVPQTETAKQTLAAWASPSPLALKTLKETMSRLAYIGCSLIPIEGSFLRHVLTLTSCQLQILRHLLDQHASFQASTVVLNGIYGAMLSFREARHGCYSDDGAEQDVAIPASWEQEFYRDYSFPAIDKEDGNMANNGWLSYDVNRRHPAALRHPRAYAVLSLCIVGQLYRRAIVNVIRPGAGWQKDLGGDFRSEQALARGASSTSNNSAPDDLAATLSYQDRYLHQLASMATFVVQDLDAVEQESMRIYMEPFDLFHRTPGGRNVFHGRRHGRLDVLSMGIYQGLHPAILSRVRQLGITLASLLDDLDELDRLPERSAYVRNCIASLYGNKYTAGPPGPAVVGERDDALRLLEARLIEDRANELTTAQYSRILAVAAGGLARLDKASKTLATSLAWAPVRCPNEGEEMARTLGALVSDKAYLTSENHAVVKSIHKQWVYMFLVKPLMAFATSPGRDVRQARICTISILALLTHIPFVVYEDDVETLARLLIRAMTTLVDWRDVDTVLDVLTHMVDNQTSGLKDHAKAMIDGAERFFTRATEQTTTEGDGGSSNLVSLATCRRRVVLFLGQLPSIYDRRYLLPFSHSVSRLLSAACGDRIREIREAAQAARKKWAEIQ